MLIEDSNDHLEKFPNLVLIDSNFDETTSIKLTCWKEDFERRLHYSGVTSVEVSNEEECDITKHTDELKDENFSLD